MPRTRTRARSAIEQDFLDALERLKVGRPQHPELREKIRRGTPVKVNIATVAKEAGRARGLIGKENCRYPEIRQLVLAEEGGQGDEPRNREGVIASLRAQVAELRVELADAKAHAALHLDLRTKAERKLADYKGRYERLRKQVEAVDLRGHGNVVALFPENGRSTDN